MRVAALLTAAVLVSPAPALPPPERFWEEKGCHTHYTSRDAREGLRTALRHTRPDVDKHRVVNLWKCVPSRREAHKAHRFAHRLWAWRHQYRQRWAIRFHRLPAYAQQWAVSTGACESGNNPATNTGNGYLGAMQWTLGTWYAAGGDRSPTSASLEHQYVVAWNWHVGHPSGQWPVCGE